MMRPFVALILVLSLVPLAAGAEEKPVRMVIPDVEPFAGPDPMVKCLATAIRIAVDPGLTEDDLYGLSGSAFLATVCANNCTCRDYREESLLVEHTLKAMGIAFEHFEGNDDAIWERIKASIGDGVPVLAWNVTDDFEDGLMTGYDEEKDLVYGLGSTTSGREYATASLSKWKAGGMYGFIIHRGEGSGPDGKKRAASALDLIVRMAHRAAMEGG